MQLTREFHYFCDIQFEFMTDNIISGHNRFLGILQKYTLKKVYHRFLFDCATNEISCKKI